MKQMRVAVFTDIGKVKLEQHPIPKVTAETILIKVEACAICTWEQRVFQGVKKVVFPFIGGHEIAGEIIEIGEHVNATHWKMGQKVVYGTNLACGDCYQCKTGNEQNCDYFDHSKQLPGMPYPGMGGFSEYLLVKPQHVFPYDSVTASEAALTEPLSCVIHSVETAEILYGDTVVVIGCGIMGLLHVQLALKSGAYVIVSDPTSARLGKAEELGAHLLINPNESNLEEIVQKVTNGQGAQVVFNTLPLANTIDSSINLLGNNGRLVLYSSFFPDIPILLSPDKIHKKALKILGTANSNGRDFMKASKMISKGMIDTKTFVSNVYEISDIQLAMEEAIQGQSYRVVIHFEEEESC